MNSKSCPTLKLKQQFQCLNFWMVIPAGTHKVNRSAGFIYKHCTPLPFIFQSITQAVYTLTVRKLVPTLTTLPVEATTLAVPTNSIFESAPFFDSS